MLRALLLAGSVLVLAGCGGDDDRLSREEFRQQATAICNRLEEQTQQVAEPESLEDVEEFGTELRDLIDDGIADLRELRPPEDLEEPYGRYLESGEQLRDQLDALVEAAADGDEAGVQQALDRGERISEASDEQARAAGIPECED